MSQQVIYGRWEYPISDNILSTDIFQEYNGMSIHNERGIIVAGLNIAIRSGNLRAVIVITYDKESDTYMKLKLSGVKNVSYINLYQDSELKRKSNG